MHAWLRSRLVFSLAATTAVGLTFSYALCVSRHVVLYERSSPATRPIVAKLIEKIEYADESELNAATAIASRRKLSVDPWLRVKGAKNVFALGDCSLIDGEALPATAQVAGQEGAYLGRLLSKGGDLGCENPPTWLGDVKKEMHPFHFLSLGAMAYIGNSRSIVQVQATETQSIKLGGRVAFALWRSVYAAKQTNARTRVLVLFDWFKARLFRGIDSMSNRLPLKPVCLFRVLMLGSDVDVLRSPFISPCEVSQL
jgi:hypothetical protein